MWNNLPVSVLNEVFRYLTVKERIVCKDVCLEWRKQVEDFDSKLDSVLLHLYHYPLNKRWCWTNQKGLVRVENSFEIDNFELFQDALNLLDLKNRNLKKIKLLNPKSVFSDCVILEIHNYLSQFVDCEELEIEDFSLGPCVIQMPQLKVLVLKMCRLFCKLEIDCPMLEVLISWVDTEKDHQVTYKNMNNCRHLECTSHSLNFSPSSERFPNLESINFYNRDNFFRKDLLSYMPNLKRMVIYTSCHHSDYYELIRQKKTYNLNDDLQVLVNGFDLDWDDMFAITRDNNTIGINEQCINEVHEFYPKMVDTKINWVIMLNYDLLFGKFRILPNDWFTRFRDVDMIWLKSQLNCNHFIGFLKHCPGLDKLMLSLADFKDARPLDLLFSLTPSIRELAIYEDNSLAVSNFDFSFLHNLKIIFVRLHSTALPIIFLRTIFRTCKYLIGFSYLHFKQTLFHLHVKPYEIGLQFDLPSNKEQHSFATADVLFDFLKNDRRLKFVCF